MSALEKIMLAGQAPVSAVDKVMGLSYNLADVVSAYNEQITKTPGGAMGAPVPDIQEIWSDFLIVEDASGQDYKLPYSVGDDGTVTFGDEVPVQEQYVPMTSFTAGALSLAINDGNSLQVPAGVQQMDGAMKGPDEPHAFVGDTAEQGKPSRCSICNKKADNIVHMGDDGKPFVEPTNKPTVALAAHLDMTKKSMYGKHAFAGVVGVGTLGVPQGVCKNCGQTADAEDHQDDDGGAVDPDDATGAPDGMSVSEGGTAPVGGSGTTTGSVMASNLFKNPLLLGLTADDKPAAHGFDPSGSGKGCANCGAGPGAAAHKDANGKPLPWKKGAKVKASGVQYADPGSKLLWLASPDSPMIKPANAGKFTAKAQKAGMSVQAFAEKVLANKDQYDTDTIQQANFAKNFGGK